MQTVITVFKVTVWRAGRTEVWGLLQVVPLQVWRMVGVMDDKGPRWCFPAFLLCSGSCQGSLGALPLLILGRLSCWHAQEEL